MNQLETFWDKNHQGNNKNLLSGCLFDETIDFLQVRSKLQSNIKILEVGVGLGFVTESLSKIGKVSAIDISEVALERVQPYCEFTFKSDNTNSLPKNYFDLVICHNVVQHIPTFELKRELADIIESLNSNGLFALEFVSNGEEDTGGEQYDLRDAEYGWLFRSVDFMKSLIEDCGGSSVCVYSGMSAKKQSNVGVHVLHIRKS